MSIRLSRLALVLTTLTLLVSCGDDTTSPTATQDPTDREVVERPTTLATARATTAASVWAINDLAALAAHWAEGDLRSAPPRFTAAAFEDVATFDDATTRWTIPLTTDFRIGAEAYEVGGTATITFLAAGSPVQTATDADALTATIVLDVLPRLDRTVQRDLAMTSTVELAIDDLWTRPLAIAGSGTTIGRYSLVDDTTDNRAAVDMQWSFELSDVYRDCCPRGVIELQLDAWRTEVTMAGQPAVATRMVVDSDWVEDVAVQLPCVLVQDARGTKLRSRAPILKSAIPRDVVLDLTSELAARAPELGMRTSGTLRLEGKLGDVTMPITSVPLDRTTRLDDAFAALEDALWESDRWNFALGVDADGRVRLDNGAQEHLPASTRVVRLWGNLDSRSEGRGTHLRNFAPLLAAATHDDDLRFLHTRSDGKPLEFADRDIIAMTGSIGGIEIVDRPFEIGRGGTTVEDLRSWFQRSLNMNGAPDATVALNWSGDFVVSIGPGDPLVEDLELVSGGRLAFNQLMLFGDEIAAGSSQTSHSSLLSPATEDDVLSELVNHDGDALNLQFEPDGSGLYTTSIRIGGTLGGQVLTPTDLTVEEGVTLLSALTTRIERAFGISNAHGVSVDAFGRPVVKGDVGLESAIDSISFSEPGNLFSNISVSLDFFVVEEARDAEVYRTTVDVFDALGATHELTFSFAKRTGHHVWDWQASFAGDEEIVEGGTGTLGFNGNGQIISWLHRPDVGYLAFRAQPESTDGDEIILLTIDPGRSEGTATLTQYAYADAIHSVADGSAFVRGADATDVTLRLLASDGARTENVVLAHFDAVPGGEVTVADHLAVNADAGTPLAELVTIDGTPLFASPAGNTRTLDLTSTIDGITTTSTTQVTGATAIENILDAVRTHLQLSPSTVYLNPDGYLVVESLEQNGIVTALSFRERDGTNAALETTLGFEITAQGTAGCR